MDSKQMLLLVFGVGVGVGVGLGFVLGQVVGKWVIGNLMLSNVVMVDKMEKEIFC